MTTQTSSAADALAVNSVLAALPEEARAPLFANAAPVSFGHPRTVYDAGDVVRQIYFPVTAVIADVAMMNDGMMVETGMVGREGAVGVTASFGDYGARGVPALLGSDAATHQALVQMEGRALLSMAVQTAACNALHTIEERLARWLLLCWQRGGSDVLPLTHEMLSNMLGVRRSGVTVAAGLLQRAGLIRYTRKDIVILDRERLEAASCECFRSMSAAAWRETAR